MADSDAENAHDFVLAEETVEALGLSEAARVTVAGLVRFCQEQYAAAPDRPAHYTNIARHLGVTRQDIAAYYPHWYQQLREEGIPDLPYPHSEWKRTQRLAAEIISIVQRTPIEEIAAIHELPLEAVRRLVNEHAANAKPSRWLEGSDWPPPGGNDYWPEDKRERLDQRIAAVLDENLTLGTAAITAKLAAEFDIDPRHHRLMKRFGYRVTNARNRYFSARGYRLPQ